MIEPPALQFRGGQLSWLPSLRADGRSADLFRWVEPTGSPKVRSGRSGAVFIGSGNCFELAVGELRSSLFGLDGLGRVGSSVLIDRDRLSIPNRGLGFFPASICEMGPSTGCEEVSEPGIFRSADGSLCVSGALTFFRKSEIEPLPFIDWSTLSFEPARSRPTGRSLSSVSVLLWSGACNR